MEDEYLTNLNTDDNELLTKLKRKEEELTKIKSELDEKSKLCLSQKHKIEDLTIENNDLVKKYDNQQNLLKFYEEKASKEEDSEIETDPEKKDKIKQLEIKIMNLNEKIKELEESLIKKDNDLEVITQELEEEKEIGAKALDLINEKEEEIENLKKKIEDGGGGGEQKKRKSVVEGDLSPEEVQALKDWLNKKNLINIKKQLKKK